MCRCPESKTTIEEARGVGTSFDHALEKEARGGGPASAVGLSPCLRHAVILVLRVDAGFARQASWRRRQLVSARRPFHRGVSGGIVPSLAQSCLAGHPVIALC